MVAAMKTGTIYWAGTAQQPTLVRPYVQRLYPHEPEPSPTDPQRCRSCRRVIDYVSGGIHRRPSIVSSLGGEQ